MSGAPPFWHERAKRMVGRTVFVGKTISQGEREPERIQFFGPIESADEKRGFAIRRSDNGQLEWLPPDLRAFQPADPGVYTLSSTGDDVYAPDYVSTWTVDLAE
jgi:hypothetical protein